MRGNLVLIGMLLTGSAFISDGNAYASAIDGSTANTTYSTGTENYAEDSSYYFIYYNGGEHSVVVNENIKLTLTGWTDESKSSVKGKIEIQKDTSTEIKEITIDANEEINVFPISETDSLRLKLAAADSFSFKEVMPQELDEQTTVVVENEEVTEENLSAGTENNTVAAVQSSSISSLANPSVKYSTHVQDYGWLTSVSDGEMSGTEGKAKRLEAIKIALENAPYSGGISYSTHVQDYGWLNSVSDDAISGTSGKSKRLEAIKINLTGEIAQHYDIYYRVHAQDYGWLGWAKNGQSAGTQGLAKRLEAIEIVLVSKGGAAPGPTNKPFVVMDPSVVYSTHVQDIGWLAPVTDGKMSGTSGQSKRMEAIKISLKNAPYSGSISYKTHVQDYGWLANVSNGALSGTSGQSKRLEAIQINLTGEMAQHYDIYYRVHAETFGWLDWAKNGASAGTAGQAKRLEAIEIVLVEKGGAAPGQTNNPFIEYSVNIAYNNYNISLNDALNMQMKVYPQTDKYRNAPAYVSSQYINVLGSISGTSVNLRTSPDVDNNNNNIDVNVGNGTLFKLLDSNVSGDSVSGSTRWYKIEYNGKILYVHSSLATTNSGIGQVTDDRVNIRSEMSTDSHIYGIVNKGTLLTILGNGSGWYNVSLGDWRNAKSSDVQEYLDPSRFVNNEIQRFQFMNLSKPSGISKDTLNKYLTGKGILANQGQAFIDAGAKYGINEVYLMAHTLLETGHGTSTLAKGVEYNGTTVYNMYGVGALDHCPIDCGAKTAYEKGWDTPYKAIVGGAAFIDDGYLGGNNYYDVVQNTLYEMRWNPQVMATVNQAGHQYATDIGWAYKQVKVMYDVYQIQKYNVYLEIPVYK